MVTDKVRRYERIGIYVAVPLILLLLFVKPDPMRLVVGLSMLVFAALMLWAHYRKREGGESVE